MIRYSGDSWTSLVLCRVGCCKSRPSICGVHCLAIHPWCLFYTILSPVFAFCSRRSSAAVHHVLVASNYVMFEWRSAHALRHPSAYKCVGSVLHSRGWLLGSSSANSSCSVPFMTTLITCIVFQLLLSSNQVLYLMPTNQNSAYPWSDVDAGACSSSWASLIYWG